MNVSLKTFHIVFILIATIFTVYFGIWSAQDYMNSSNTGSLLMSIASVAGVIVLVVYFRWFLRKWKTLS